jgi:hypothetical protein
MLNKVTVRNLKRYAGTSLSYWSIHINGQVAMWSEPCVQGSNQENTSTALQKGVHITQEPKFNRLKIRKNLRTTGFNLYKYYKGKRSVHSTLCIKKGTQVSRLFVDSCRSFSTKILSNNLNERVLTTELKQMVEKCKNKDGRYGNLNQIIGSLSTIKLAYLMVKNNLSLSAKSINNDTLNSINLKILEKISLSVLDGSIKFFPVRRVYTSKSNKIALLPLSVRRLYEKIVEKSIEIVLTIIFEKIFLNCSHGFRPGRNCHTALKHLQLKIDNASIYTWVIEGDIKEYFDNISHKIILKD